MNIKVKKVVAMIPIKLNNQRLPGKNLKILGKKVLCQYLFDTVKQIKEIDEVYVYCSDSSIQKYMPEEIHFLQRPKELDTDTVQSKDIIQKFIEVIDADIYVLMHVTQPFIKAETISNSISKVKEENYDSAFVAYPIKEFAWYNGKPINYELTNVVRTQELEPLYIEGELFVFEKEVFTKEGRRIGSHPWIQPINWKENICIDEIDDLEMAETIIELEKKDEGYSK